MTNAVCPLCLAKWPNFYPDSAMGFQKISRISIQIGFWVPRVLSGVLSSPDMAFISVPNDAWLADSACSSHISTQRSYFSEYAPISNHFIKGLGNQPVTGIGTMKLISNVDGKACTITLKDVLYVPKAPHNLISLGRITSAKIQVLFTDKDVRFRVPNHTIIAKGTKISNLYLMDVKVSAKQDHVYSIKVGAHT